MARPQGCAAPSSSRLTPVANHALHPGLNGQEHSAFLIAAIARVVRLSTRHAWVVIAAFLIAAVLAGGYVARHIAINTDSGKLLSSSLPWRQQEIKLNAAVPAADRPDRRGHRRDDAGSGRRSGERAGQGAGASDQCYPRHHPAGRRRILRPQRRLVPQRRRPAAQYGRTDQGGAFPRNARPRSDFARDPRRHLAIARRRSAQENDASKIIKPALVAHR